MPSRFTETVLYVILSLLKYHIERVIMAQTTANAPQATTSFPGGETAAIQEIKKIGTALSKELSKVFIGQNQTVEEVLIALMAKGHVLLIGVPGLGKTLLVNSIAKLLNLEFKRVQFTPDLMPTDIIGTDIIEENVKTGERYFKFMKGPLFTQLLLADEINRTPPKTQAALLQAMQERKVTSGTETYTLQEPFFVLATQNPIEQEGTYPLPEAQLDRFMFNIKMNYPPLNEEIAMVKATTTTTPEDLKPIVTAEQILQIQEIVRSVPVSDKVLSYAVMLAEATRPGLPNSKDFINSYVTWGAGPRAGQYLILGAKARALLKGRFFVSCEDIEALAYAVLRHRILLNFTAEAEGMNTDALIAKILQTVTKPV